MDGNDQYRACDRYQFAPAVSARLSVRSRRFLGSLCRISVDLTKLEKKRILRSIMYMIRRCIPSTFFLCVFSVCLYAAPAKISFSADKMQGTGGKGNSSTALTGNAKVSVDSLSIRGERIELYGKDYRYIKASGTVTGEDPEKGFTFSAASLLYDRETEVAEFMGSAKVEDTKNKVETSAERIEYNQKNEIILLQMAVHLKSKDIVCDSLFAVYNRTSSMLDLTGRPVVKKGKDEFKAVRISVDLNTEDIRLEGKVRGSVTEEKKSSEKSDAKESASTETSPKGTNAAGTASQGSDSRGVQEKSSGADSREQTAGKQQIDAKTTNAQMPKDQPALEEPVKKAADKEPAKQSAGKDQEAQSSGGSR